MTEPILSPAEEADADRLLDGLRERPEQYAGLTVLEAAAARTSAHMSTCDRASRLECRDCGDELHAIRRYLVAVEPVITEEATQPFRERLAAAELVCDIFGAAGWDSPRTERTNATEQAWQDWYAAYGVGVRTPDDVIAALAARRDEIRARALTRIHEEDDDAPAPRHAVPDDGSYPDGAPVAADLGQERSEEQQLPPEMVCPSPNCHEECDGTCMARVRRDQGFV